MGKSTRDKFRSPFTDNQKDIYIRIFTQATLLRYHAENKKIHVIQYNKFTYLHYWITYSKTQMIIDYRLSHSTDHIDIPNHNHQGIITSSL